MFFQKIVEFEFTALGISPSRNCFDVTIIMDFFPWHMPYNFRLEAFLKYMQTNDLGLFEEFKWVQSSIISDLKNWLDTKGINWKKVPLVKMGKANRECSTVRMGHVNAMRGLSEREFANVVTSVHPCVYVDRSISVKDEKILNSQKAIDFLLNAIAYNENSNKVYQGRFTQSFINKDAKAIGASTRVSAQYGFGGEYESTVSVQMRVGCVRIGCDCIHVDSDNCICCSFASGPHKHVRNCDISGNVV